MRIFLSIAVIAIFGLNLCAQFSGDTVRAIYIDNNDIKWIGTDLGLLRFDDTSWKAYNSRRGEPGSIWSIEMLEREDTSSLWIGTENGLLRAFVQNNLIDSAQIFHKENSILESSEIVSISYDNSHSTYFATPIGLGIIEDDLWTWLPLGWGPPESGVPTRRLTSLASKNDTVYIGAIDRGAGRIINEVDGFSGASYYEVPWAEIVGNHVTSIITDDQGYQWFGTTEGLSRHTNQSSFHGWDINLNSNDGLIDNEVNCLFQDRESNIWIGTNKGVSKFIIASREFQNFKTEDGLADSIIFDISQDQHGNIWFATANGISVFNGIKFNNYQTADFTKDFAEILTSDPIRSKLYPVQQLTVYPNPATNYCYIHFRNEGENLLEVGIFNTSGKRIKTLHSGISEFGDIKLRWDLKENRGPMAPAGIYFVQIRHGADFHTEKLVIF